MGADIHTYREKRVNGVWLSDDVWETETYDDGYQYAYVADAIERSRNYYLFGMLAKVRLTYAGSLEPKGMPSDASSEVLKACCEIDDDGHSHSWVNLEDVIHLIGVTLGNPDSARVSQWILPPLVGLKKYLEDLPEGVEEKRVVFWFDN